MLSSNLNRKSTPNKFSLDLSFKLALKSVEDIRKNRDSTNLLLHTLLTAALSLVAAAPLVYKSFDIDWKYCSIFCLIAVGIWFSSAVGACIFILIGRLTSRAPILNPDELLDRGIYLSELQFKRGFLRNLQAFYKEGVQMMARTRRYVLSAVICVILEVISLSSLVLLAAAAKKKDSNFLNHLLERMNCLLEFLLYPGC